jgi:hypothetical protein
MLTEHLIAANRTLRARLLAREVELNRSGTPAQQQGTGSATLAAAHSTILCALLSDALSRQLSS